MGRIAELTARTDGAATLVGWRDAWVAAGIVTARFPGRGSALAARVVNWLRLVFVSRAVTNRDRTAVIGVGGTRPAALVGAALVAAWLGPRLPRWLLAASVGAVAVAAVRRGRLRRLVWVASTLRREAPGALVIGEFAAAEPGAGVAFATDLLEAVGAHSAMALSVQGPPGDRHARSLVRLYERRLGFRVVARTTIAGDELVVMVRPITPPVGPRPLRAVG